MYRPSRIRRILKWIAAVICIAICAICGLSLEYGEYSPVGHHWYLGFDNGFVRLWEIRRLPPSPLSPNQLHPHGLWGLGLELPMIGTSPVGDRFVDIPFWILLLLTATPTALLWYRDRRRIPLGHCARCGYDLTGNTSGVCSECGEKVSASPVTSRS